MLKRSIELCEVIRGAILSEAQSSYCHPERSASAPPVILSEAQSPYCHPERSAAESKDLCVKMK